MTYTLKIVISAADLAGIAAVKENIVLVKQVSGQEPFSWLSFPPFESNVVTWDENYSLYATWQQGSDVAIINVSTETPAQPMKNYNLTTEGFSEPAPATVCSNCYQVTNLNSAVPNISFGLMQKATVNGTEEKSSAINAQLVPLNQRAVFKPLSSLTIFLASNVPAGIFVDPDTITGLISGMAPITFAEGSLEATVTYDSARGCFVQNA